MYSCHPLKPTELLTWALIKIHRHLIIREFFLLKKHWENDSIIFAFPSAHLDEDERDNDWLSLAHIEQPQHNTQRTHGDFLTKSTEGSDRIDPLFFPHISLCLHFTLWGGSVSHRFRVRVSNRVLHHVSLYFLHAHNSSSLLVLLVAVRFSYITATLSHHQESRERGKVSIFADIFEEYISLPLLWSSSLLLFLPSIPSWTKLLSPTLTTITHKQHHHQP